MTNNGIAAYQWTQVQIPTNMGPQGPVVILQGSNTATPIFVAPILPYDITLAFSLKVMDSDGGAVSNNPTIVYVIVKHNPNNIGPTTPGTTIIQPQELKQQQSHPPIVPNNNSILPPLQTNHAPSASLPQTGLTTIHNQAVP
jgi:hypothetical protein